MNQGDGEGDPFELDPFGESEYDPSLAFAHVAAQQARERVVHAQRFVEHELAAHPDRLNQLSVSARKSSGIQLADLFDLAAEIDESRKRVDLYDSASVEFRQAVNDTVERFHELKGAYDQLMHTAAQIAAADPARPSSSPIEVDPTTLLDPRPASQKIHGELRSWLNAHRGNEMGNLVVVKATPGVGKTYAMLKEAYREHMARQRVVFSVRTKEMIAAPDAEMRDRVVKMSPTGRVELAVIYGRDETNCMKHETVEAVMAHGYAPGPAVCMQCEYYPDNAGIYGMGICGYYQERIVADLMSKGARRGSHRQYPFVLTTQASLISATIVQGGRYGKFWGADILFFDEDPTDAMEIDVVLSETQCEFQSRSHETKSAGIVAQLCKEAIEIAKRERATSEDNGFKAPGSKELNTHPIHSKYDSVYVAEDLQHILQRALAQVAVTQQVSNLQGTLRSVTAGGFFVQPGTLAQATSADDINALDVPPKSLATIAEAVHSEFSHAQSLRRLIYEQNMGRYPDVGSHAGSIIEELERHTEVEPMSYMVRLECLPADTDKGRLHDEWRFVARDFRPLANNTSLVVVGDAYAQKDHYEHLFERDADMIDVVSELNPEARFLRVLDSRCNISELRRGGLQRVLALAEAQLREEATIGDRVLLYGHQELRPKVEQWIQGIAESIGLTWAYEHWWGGRGKDQYNGWEFTLCLSDPVQSLSGLKHVANARAFRDSVSAKTTDEKLLHARRCDIGSDKRGPVYALRASDARIALEHDRMNVAELTQALHRARPAHHPVRIITYGEMEQSPDLIAQTETVVGPESRKVATAHARRKRRTKQQVSTVDSFVTLEEAIAAIRAIIAHYGVYSSWFSHALVAVLDSDGTLPQAEPNAGTQFRSAAQRKLSDSDGLEELWHEVDPVVFNRASIDHGINPIAGSILEAPGPQISGGERESVPGVDRGLRPSARSGSTEPARPTAPLAVLPNPRTIIERVWHPPVYWRQLKSARQQPKAIETAHARLTALSKAPGSGIRAVTTQRWPKWAEGLMSGRRPQMFFDPELLRVDAALRAYYRIVDKQYGPVKGGRLVRPNAEIEVPGSMSAVPF